MTYRYLFEVIIAGNFCEQKYAGCAQPKNGRLQYLPLQGFLNTVLIILARYIRRSWCLRFGVNCLVHGCAKVAHCVTSPTTVAHYVSMTCSEHREALTASPTADSVHKQAIRVQG